MSQIGQLQRFLPTFMDQHKTEKYFHHRQNSSSTLVGASDQPGKDKQLLSAPSNVHHRTRSAPIAFTKGVTDHRNRQLERDGSLGQFQQISLISEETVLEKIDDDVDESLRRSLSGGSSRARSATVTVAPAQVKSSLHRSVSLNKHHQGTINSRLDPTTMMLDEDESGVHVNQLGDNAEDNLVAPNRFSALLDFSQGANFNLNSNNSNNNDLSTGNNSKSNRYSDTSIVGIDSDFDPTRFSSTSIMFDARRLSHISNLSDEDDEASPDDFRKTLPPHQQQPSFHSHHNSPTLRSREMSVEILVPVVAPAPVQVPILAHQPSPFGDKQELDEDDDADNVQVTAVPQPTNPYGTQQTYSQQEFYPPLQQHVSMPMHMPMPMPMPTPMPTMHTQNQTQMPMHMQAPMSMPPSASPRLPPRIMVPRPHGGQEMSLATDDMEMEDEHPF
ncbi:hypothetical protein BGZ99_005570 [Dissophora globulifera]|uniref:Uncharacterized protein n=1 Tax=Dissophora globulifera TaxID=979702 RepID=A0A9P6RJ29_9FUNG|nr:hypothetical protein BGZ99_005570 [Dissophora globulifera]